MIITITGKEGSGTTTMAELLEKKIGYEFVYIGRLYRQFAVEKYHDIAPGRELSAANDHDKNAPYEETIDKLVDEHIAELARTKDRIIIEGRTARIFANPEAKALGKSIIHIYVDVDENVGAQRIYASAIEKTRAPGESGIDSVDDALQIARKRLNDDSTRYLRFYGEDPHNPKTPYDITQDSSAMNVGAQLTNLSKQLIDFLTNAEIGEDVVKALSN